MMRSATTRRASASFPNNMLAGMFGFANRDYFEADAAAQEVPTVEF